MAANEETAREITKRAERAFQTLQLFNDLYERAFRLGYPSRLGWYERTPGERKNRQVYDSTFGDAWERLANAIYTGMCPPWAQWFHLLPGVEVREDQQEELAQLLQPLTRAMWQTLSYSNFYTELHPAIVDLIAGTCHLLVDYDDKKGVYFKSVPIYEVAIESDNFGVVAHFWRRKVKARHLQREFPNVDLPADLYDAMRHSPDEEITILSATVPNDENPRFEAKQYVVYEKGKKILEERDFYENPWATARWSVLSGEDYGRGPALRAEPSAYSLNEAAKLMLMAANLSLFGMWLVDIERVPEGTVQLGVGALIPVRAAGGNVSNAMSPLVPSTKFEIAEYALESLRSQIKRTLYRDNLAEVDRANMTATEVLERQAMVAQDMGAAYGRLTNELLQPILKRVAGILSRTGNLPTEFKLDGRTVTVQYTSALARAQQFEEVLGMRAFVGDVANLTAIDPRTRFVVDTVKYARRIARLTGVDLETMREENEVDQLMVQQAQGQAALMEAAQQAAGVQQGQGAPPPTPPAQAPVPGNEEIL